MGTLSPAQARRQAFRQRDGRYATAPRVEAALNTLASVPTAGPVGGVFAERPEALTRRYDTLDDKIDAFQAEIADAMEHLADDENWRRYLDNLSKFHRYSTSNQMLIMLQSGGRASQVAGFKRWKDLGRAVRKGEKGIAVLAPKVVNRIRHDNDGRPVLDDDGQKMKERIVVGFTTATVFDVAQTDGDPIDPRDDPTETPPDGLVDDLTAAAEHAGYTVRSEPLHSRDRGGAQGWTATRNRPGGQQTREIVVDSTLAPAEQVSTLAHEIGHVYAGHTDRDDYHTGSGGCRGQMEVEADSIAYTLTRANGMTADGARATGEYVHHWSRGDTNLVRKSAESVASTVRNIFEAVPFRNLRE